MAKLCDTSKRGYIQTYQWVVKLLADCNFAQSAKRMGLQLIQPNVIAIDFLGRTYTIAQSDVNKDALSFELTGDKIKWTVNSEGFEYNLKSVLGYYILSDAEVNALEDYCTIGSFSHGVFGRSGALFDSALGKSYGTDYKKFCESAEKLGMVFEAERHEGQYIWRYSLLPKVPVKLVYYTGDDEYPTNIQILYDKTAIQVFKFEPLAVLNGCFTAAFAAVG
jgi:hypothetical protein